MVRLPRCFCCALPLTSSDDQYHLFPSPGNGGTLDVTLNATGQGIGFQSNPQVAVDLTLRDDVWNTYDWDPSSGNGHFNWNWLECCTDGMVMGILPNGLWSYTFFWDLAKTQNMDGGTQVHHRPLRSPLRTCGTGLVWVGLRCTHVAGSGMFCTHAALRVSQAIAWDPRNGNAIKYDIPMHMTVLNPYIGVQVTCWTPRVSCV